VQKRERERAKSDKKIGKRCAVFAGRERSSSFKVSDKKEITKIEHIED
jgi:hypothetical protein